jgi:hypothetical protein
MGGRSRDRSSVNHNETIIFSLFVGQITIPVTWLNKKMQFAADL